MSVDHPAPLTRALLRLTAITCLQTVGTVIHVLEISIAIGRESRNGASTQRKVLTGVINLVLEAVIVLQGILGHVAFNLRLHLVEISGVQVLCVAAVARGEIEPAVGEILLVETGVPVAVSLVDSGSAVAGRFCEADAVASVAVCKPRKRNMVEAVAAVVGKAIDGPFVVAFGDEMAEAGVVFMHPAVQRKVQLRED